MNHSRLYALCCLLACLLCATRADAQTPLGITESAARVTVEAGRIIVSLPVNNTSPRGVTTRLKLELLDTFDNVQATVERDEMIAQGATTLTVPLTISEALAAKLADGKEQLFWHRLRYRLTPGPSGVLALSQITPSLFEINLIHPTMVRAGEHFRAQVRAAHPLTARPAAGVRVTCSMEINDDTDHVVKASAVTGDDGLAVCEFDVPREVQADRADLNAHGERDGFRAETSGDILIDALPRLAVSTDKPIYQPGQTLHLRALAFDPTMRAVAGGALIVKIADPEETVVYRTVINTSRFGVASTDWPIPDNARLGNYDISCQTEGGSEWTSFRLRVRVSRYDLPNFAVNVKPDRAYYLPGQNADVTVRGDYLFGQTLTRGHVRVVRETSREWNFREQKWEIEEEEKVEGELDSAGRFVARLDLTKMHHELAENNYGRFRDASYTAYITDPTTGRTEQRRFDLRVTREAIHVYVISDRPMADGPFAFYVTTFYADGTPAPCDVTINEAFAAESADREPIERWLRSARTNRYGLAKVILTAGHEEKRTLRVTARDSRGAVGHEAETLDSPRSAWLQVETDRTVYRPGQSIRAAFRATQTNATLFAYVTVNGRVIRSREVALRGGKARLTFDYAADFKGKVTIAAHIYDEANNVVTAQRMVLYPSNSELRLDVKMSAASFKPGAEANATFTVRTTDQSAAASALGVAIIDRAVQERARTDAEPALQQSFTRATQQLLGEGDPLAGVTISQLKKAAAAGPVPADLDLLAEVLLRQDYYVQTVTQADVERLTPDRAFNLFIASQYWPIKDALNQHYTRTGKYPTSESQLTAFLSASGVNWTAMRDPWDMPYRPEFPVNRDRQELRLVSAGADKRFGTADDFTAIGMDWHYFAATGLAIDRALRDYHKRTGRFIRDRETLRAELLAAGTDINAMPDPWGRPYEFRFGVSRQYYTLEVVSGGPNRRLEPRQSDSDDFTVLHTQQEYFVEQHARVDAALTAYVKAHDRFPQDDAELDRALAESNIQRADLRDGWGHLPYATFRSASRYADRVRFYSFAQYGEPAGQKTELTPVTQTIKYVTLRSAGEDGKAGTADDFDLGSYSRLFTEQESNQPTPQQVRQVSFNTNQAGALAGLVTDPQGAAVAGAKVIATNTATKVTYETTTDDEGHFLLRDLPSGTYEVQVDAQGFHAYIAVNVPVQPPNVTGINVTLSVGSTSEMVEVSAGGGQMVQTQSAEMSATTESKRAVQLTSTLGAAARQSALLSTPRLREYFPETLLWQPSIETDEQGRASLRFKLADNITTWRLAVVASTVDGRVGVAEADVLAFQPFFVEHDPPSVLTAGDEISLPVVVRNYLGRRQAVELELNPAPWFRLLSAPRQRTKVNAGDATRVTFDFRATAPVNAGPQRVTAKSAEAGDAIERRVSVHPDGEEITTTTSQVFGESATITTEIPATAINDTARGELKIYPNLSAHVLEAIEAIMQRPYGCAEQTISSAYPSLLVLRLYERRGEEVPPIAERARRYVQAGYERLLNYRDEAGGFTYWGRGNSDVALTAYALQFLNDASRFISVDEDVMTAARDWLITQQRADGTWPAFNWKREEDQTRTAMLTAVVARALARAAGLPATQNRPTQGKNGKPVEPANVLLDRTLNYLSRRTEEIDEPYLIAAYVLAATEAHRPERAAQATARLVTLAHKESETAYWSLETNTPYYGWGAAGRVEATALAVQALAASGATNTEARRHEDAELINHGLLFLLRQQDRYGVWYSTQASVQVLAALVTMLSEREASVTGGPDTAEIIVNGKRAAQLAMPHRDGLTRPLTVDISSYLATGSNRVEIHRASAAQASAQLVASHYEPWDKAARDDEKNQPLRLKVTFDKTELKAGDEVTCRVEAERVGFRGYGMMLAEVGLPPGADVDRASLDRAMSDSDWDVSRYDVLPDRLILYLWPKAGGTRFAFKFKPRYGLKAQTAPSVLYDYYNPEARVTLAPTRFVVR